MLLSRADFRRYPHRDLATLEDMLAASQARRKLVVSDAVFSMGGDIAPVHALLRLCERYDAWLVLDDEHGFGVLGSTGGGVLQPESNSTAIDSRPMPNRRVRIAKYAMSADDDLDPAVLRLADARAGWHKQMGIAEALDGDGVLRNPVAHQFDLYCLSAA